MRTTRCGCGTGGAGRAATLGGTGVFGRFPPDGRDAAKVGEERRQHGAGVGLGEQGVRGDTAGALAFGDVGGFQSGRDALASGSNDNTVRVGTGERGVSRCGGTRIV